MRTLHLPRFGALALLLIGGMIGLAGCGPEATATLTPTPPANSTPAATATSAPTGPDAWTQVRAALPPSVLVLRPTWLPEQFREAPVLAYADNASGTGPLYKITYRSTADDVIGFVLGSENTAPPEGREPITVRGVPGQLFSTSAASPSLWVSWQEGANTYQVLAYGAQNPLTRDDLLRIIGSLTPVP